MATTDSRSDAFVFFGATGDLAFKQVFPALQTLAKNGRLEMPVVAVGRQEMPREKLLARVKDSLDKSGQSDAAGFDALAKRLSYARIDFDDSRTFGRIRDAIGGAARPLHYLALPPDTFAGVGKSLGAAGLAKGARLALEKPFGKDARSARALAASLHESFAEEQLFRIDHFLGKETVENLVYVRAANPIVESSLSGSAVESVQITMAETFGVERRAKLYDELGAVRDVVQNHLFEVIACLTMDLATGPGDGGLRGARSARLKELRTLRPDDIVRGQAKGYREQEGVARGSTTETFAALRVWIDSPRWKGVPFYIRAGKSLAVTATEVVVRWKPARCPVLDDRAPPPANHLRFRIGPDAVIALGTSVKKGGRTMQGEPRELVVHRAPSEALEPYERLLGDAIDGDPTLFARMDAVLESWRVVDPVLGDATPVHSYEPGSWGPAEAARIVPPGGWYDPA